MISQLIKVFRSKRLSLILLPMTLGGGFFLTACGSAQPSLKLPALEKPDLPKYTGPRFRVAVARFKSLEEAKPLLKQIGFDGIEGGLTEMATNTLVEAGYLRVLERSLLGGVSDNLQVEADAELFDQKTTEKKGNFLGAEYTLVGAVEQVEPNISSTQAGASIPFLVDLKTSQKQASVRLGIRLVHSKTGEVVASGTGHGVVETSGLGFDANNIPVGGALSASAQFGSSSRTPLGYAFHSALYQAIESIAKQLKKAPWSCRVASAAPPKVFIECGAQHRLKAGMRFQLYSRKGEIKNAKGQLIGYDDQLNGEVVLKSVQPKMSIGAHTGDAPAVAGDVVVLEQ